MDKRLITGLCLLLLSVAVTAQSKKQIKELKIKSCTETTVTYTDGKEATNYKSGFRTFDKDGNTTEDVEYNSDGSVKRREVVKYAGKEKAEEIIDTRGDKDTENNSKSNYKRTTYKYNNNGDKTEEVEYDVSGNVIRKTTYAYTKNGDKQFEMVYDGSGKLIRKTVYGYDTKGLRISKTIYGPGEVIVKMVKYTYGY